ncbi:hypothetical protein A5N73_04265 [Prescottella equi]|nr:hypothetical protein A5N73_04265 [Prescottella equi]
MHNTGITPNDATIVAPMNRPSQQLRTATTSAPRTAHEIDSASGTVSNMACTSNPTFKPTNTDANVRPPRKPQLDATSSATRLISA